MWFMTPEVIEAAQANMVLDHLNDRIGVRRHRTCSRCDVTWTGVDGPEPGEAACWCCGRVPS